MEILFPEIKSSSYSGINRDVIREYINTDCINYISNDPDPVQPIGNKSDSEQYRNGHLPLRIIDSIPRILK